MCIHAEPFIINGTHAVFVSLTVVLCEAQVSLKSSRAGVASTNQTSARRRSANYTPAATTGEEGGVKEVADDRETLNRAVLTGMACCPFPINSQIFVVEWIRLPLRRFPTLQLVFTLSINTSVMPLMRHLNWINMKLSSSETELSALTFELYSKKS